MNGIMEPPPRILLTTRGNQPMAKQRKNQTTVAVRSDWADDFDAVIGATRPKSAVLNVFMKAVTLLPGDAVDPFLRSVERGAVGDHEAMYKALMQTVGVLRGEQGLEMIDDREAAGGQSTPPTTGTNAKDRRRRKSPGNNASTSRS
jgi:hypothetical protein